MNIKFKKILKSTILLPLISLPLISLVIKGNNQTSSSLHDKQNISTISNEIQHSTILMNKKNEKEFKNKNIIRITFNNINDKDKFISNIERTKLLMNDKSDIKSFKLLPFVDLIIDKNLETSEIKNFILSNKFRSITFNEIKFYSNETPSQENNLNTNNLNLDNWFLKDSSYLKSYSTIENNYIVDLIYFDYEFKPISKEEDLVKKDFIKNKFLYIKINKKFNHKIGQLVKIDFYNIRDNKQYSVQGKLLVNSDNEQFLKINIDYNLEIKQTYLVSAIKFLDENIEYNTRSNYVMVNSNISLEHFSFYVNDYLTDLNKNIYEMIGVNKYRHNLEEIPGIKNSNYELRSRPKIGIFEAGNEVDLIPSNLFYSDTNFEHYENYKDKYVKWENDRRVREAIITNAKKQLKDYQDKGGNDPDVINNLYKNINDKIDKNLHANNVASIIASNVGINEKSHIYSWNVHENEGYYGYFRKFNEFIEKGIKIINHSYGISLPNYFNLELQNHFESIIFDNYDYNEIKKEISNFLKKYSNELRYSLKNFLFDYVVIIMA
ncbi:S8 family serine peptidase [Ureaplasma urealyticum]|nr:S8 family serine peptidase [Ureaplasma urealyticum]MDU3864590.1 S8 family serine peptidase [Ureaplasma urealyticum]UIU15016.1 S8 family serine peptidase [Ureaplasma urealyticum]